MNDKLKYDHFKNTKELLEHIAVWYRDDDVYFSRWFGLNDLNNLRIYINQLQSNWNSLREWIKEYLKSNDKWYKNELSTHDKIYYGDIYTNTEFMLKKFLDKMNELEGKDNNE